MVKKTDRKMERTRRHIRVRRKISGTLERPRLCVYRSNTNLYVQIIDDVAGNTLVSASTLDKEIKTKHANKEAAKEVSGTLYNSLCTGAGKFNCAAEEELDRKSHSFRFHVSAGILSVLGVYLPRFA